MVARETMHTQDLKGVPLSSTEERRFRELFGCSVTVAHALWNLLLEKAILLPEDSSTLTIKDMLRALLSLKSYGKEATVSIMVGILDPKTYRKNLWLMVEAISSLESIVVCLIMLLFFFNFIGIL